MSQTREIFWYIFTNDAYTNEAISRELPTEDIVDTIKCFDGIERKLWKCDGQFVTKMKRNEKLQNFHFEVFKKEGKYGSIKKCNFFDKKRKPAKAICTVIIKKGGNEL